MEDSPEYDLCVIGGGVNGAGIARDAAGRGLSVLLVEAGDLASATSSASTKLIHGGLRYLEYFEFRLVRDSLREREKLLSIAPHIIWPMDFVLPHDPTQRPLWMIRAGLFIYDHLARRKTIKSSRSINLENHDYAIPLKRAFAKGFSYSDCWVDDSRLVVLNAVDAAEKGAEILTRTACISLRDEGDRWAIQLKNMRSAKERLVTARMVVNAAGPWVRNLLESAGLAHASVPHVRLVKGSHIIIRRAFEGQQAYMLQQTDKRIVFVIPYEQDYTLIGTTEVEFTGNPSQVAISEEEIDYLCAAFNNAFSKEISRQHVEWAYSGVRPLIEDGEEKVTSATRDYHLHLHEECGAILLSVFGGKLTTYRILAEQVMSKLCAQTGQADLPWTALSALPGGNIPEGGFEKFVRQKNIEYPFLPLDLVRRYARAYGTRMDQFLEGAQSLSDLGKDCGRGIYEAEILYLVKREFAMEPEDIFWRRSKLGLHVDEKTIARVEKLLRQIHKKDAA